MRLEGSPSPVPFLVIAMSHAPQYSLKMVLAAMATCSVSFALLSEPSHIYMMLAAGSIPTFWAGAGFAVLGGVIENQGDTWLVPGAVMAVVGSVVCVLAVFTGLFYLVMLGLITLAS